MTETYAEVAKAGTANMNASQSAMPANIVSRQSLSKSTLFNSSTLSDVTLCFSGEQIHCHKCILITHSGFFNKAYTGAFDGATSHTTELKEDNPEHVRGMLRFLYDLDYVEMLTPLTMALHVHMYLIADKYDIPQLQDLAFNNFRTVADAVCLVDEVKDEAKHFIEAVDVIYTAPLLNECKFRTYVLSLCCKHLPALLRMGGVPGRALVNVGELAVEPLAAPVVNGSSKSIKYRAYKCGEDGCSKVWSVPLGEYVMHCPYCTAARNVERTERIGTMAWVTGI